MLTLKKRVSSPKRVQDSTLFDKACSTYGTLEGIVLYCICIYMILKHNITSSSIRSRACLESEDLHSCVRSSVAYNATSILNQSIALIHLRSAHRVHNLLIFTWRGPARKMSKNQNEFFYRNGRGYDPPNWYSGYDKNWILGRRTAPPAQQQGKSKNAPKGVIVLKMSLCCEGCVEKVKSKLIDLDGVTSVECSTEQQKVTVRGEVKPKAVLAAAKKISSRADIWNDEKKK